MNYVRALEVFVKEGVKTIVGDFTSPKSDLEPTAFIVTHDGDIGVISIDPEFMNSEKSKDALANVIIPKALREHKAVCFGMAVASWFVSVTDSVMAAYPGVPEDEIAALIYRDYGGLEKCPWSFDAISILIISANSATSFLAQVHRHDDGTASLGDWKETSTVEGRFVDPVRSILTSYN